MTDEKAQAAVMGMLTDIKQQITEVRNEQAVIRAAQAEINGRLDEVESSQVTDTQVASKVEAAKSESAAYVDTKIDAFSKRIDEKFKGLETRVVQSMDTAVKSLTDSMRGAIERFEDIANAMRAQVEANAEIVRVNRYDIKDQVRKLDIVETAVQSNDERAALIHRDLYGDAARAGLIADWRESQETIAELLKIQQDDAARKEKIHGYITAFIDNAPTGRRGAMGMGMVVAFMYYAITYLPHLIGG